MTLNHKIRYNRPNAANQEPYLTRWVHVDIEKNISVMYAQHSKDETCPDWERISHIDGDFAKRLVEEYLNDDAFLVAWERMKE